MGLQSYGRNCADKRVGFAADCYNDRTLQERKPCGLEPVKSSASTLIRALRTCMPRASSLGNVVLEDTSHFAQENAIYANWTLVSTNDCPCQMGSVFEDHAGGLHYGP